MFVTEGDTLVAAPPARGAPRTQCGLVLLLCGLLLLRHVSNHLLPSANFGSATVKGSAALFSTRYSHCRSADLHVKSASRKPRCLLHREDPRSQTVTIAIARP